MRILSIALIGFMWLAPRVVPFETDAAEVTEEHLREVQELRRELNPTDARPRVSQKALYEADAIREEILNAVKNNQYIHGSAPDTHKLHSAHLWGSVGNLFKRRRVATNQVDESSESDSDFHIRFPHLMQTYRDVLYLNSVEEDMSFDLGENVTSWKTLHQRKLGKHSLIGITNSSVVLLKETEGHYEFVRELKLPSTPTTLEGFSRWDAEDKAAEGIALVGIANELLWIDLGTDFDELTISWRWNLQKTLTEIDFFSLMEDPMVMLFSETIEHKTLDIYRFDYASKDFWLVQTIPLNVSSTSVAVLEDGSNLIIAIPQKNITALYKYAKESSFNQHFTHFLDIESPEVAHVASFHVEGFSHVAIGGNKPQIMRLEDDSLKPVEIHHGHFGLVDFWLPIVIKTYRDDLIILVQHRVLLHEHIVTKLEVLLWNGKFFSVLPNVPCILSDIESKYGIRCMLDFDRERGLEGSTIIRHDRNISILVPRDDADSGLFLLNMEMRADFPPELEHLEEFKMMYEYFSELDKHKDRVLEEALDSMKNAAKVNEFNHISAHWKVKSLQTEAFEVAADQVEFEREHKIIVGHKIWTPDDSRVHIPTLSDILDKIDDDLGALMSKVPEKTQARDSRTISLGTIASNGQFSTEGMYILTPDDHHRGKRQTRQINATELIVKYLDVESINGIPVSDFVFSGSEEIAIESDLIITGPLEVEDVRGKVNGRSLHEEVSAIESETLEFGSLHITGDLTVQQSVNGINVSQLFNTSNSSDVLADDNITISGNLTFNTLNNVDWKKFMQSIVMTNRPISLEKIKINGEVFFVDDLWIDSLNNITFPGGYLWASNGSSDKPSTAVITGRKKFKTLVATSIDAEKTINGFDVERIITINSDQHIPGETTFGELNVVGRLEVDGEIKGRHLDKFLKNPTLLETKTVHTACLFRDLRVEGNIIVNNSLNGMDLDSILKNAVYTTDKTINVVAFKSFENVTFSSGITLTSGLLNSVPLKEYVTRDTEQELHIKEINGDIYFHALTLDGLFNDVNVTELDYNSVKLSGQQHTEAEIIFENDDLGDFVDVIAGKMEVSDTINGFKVHDLIDTTEDLELDADVEFEELRVDHLETKADLIGKFLVNDIDLEDFDRRRLSLSREQTIEVPFHIDHADIDSLHVSRLNNVSIEKVESLLKNAGNLQEAIRSGQMPIDSLTIHGDVYLEILNGQNFTEIAANAIWLNESNVFTKDVNFLDKINFNGNLSVDSNVNTRDFKDFLSNLVSKSNDTIVLTGHKTFKKDLHVTEGVEVAFINDLNVSSILTQDRYSVIDGDLTVSGNLTVQRLILNGKINRFPFYKLTDLYSYDLNDNFHHIWGNVYLQDHPYVDHLIVDGYLNDLKNITEYVKGIQMKSQKVFNFTGKKIFTRPAFFRDSLGANFVNGIDFRDLVENVIINDPYNTVEIHGDVYFDSTYPRTYPIDSFIETPEIFIGGNLTAESIVGCNPGQLIREAVWKDEDMHLFMNITFHPGVNAESIETGFLNGIPMSKYITLHTEQEIEDTLVVADVEVNQPISVDGFVNGVKLPEEHENTLMTYGDQTVETSASFQLARVLNSLTTSGEVNNQNIRSVALLSSDLIITTPVSFDHLQVEDMFTEHIISGINFTNWHDNVLWRRKATNQTVSGRWVFKKCHIEESLEGDGAINQIDFANMMNFTGNWEKLAEKVKYTEKLNAELCRKVNSLLSRSRHDICFFRYFELHDSIWEKGEEISSHLFYENNGQSYFIYSAGCRSKLYQWLSGEKRFALLTTINTGQIIEWIHVEDDIGNAHLVASSLANDKCSESGSAVWKWNGFNLIKLTQMDQTFHSIQKNGLRPGHFYAIDEENDVTEFDLRGESGEKWKKPLSAAMKFIPQEINLGLAVTDGKHIKVIRRNSRRRRRRMSRAVDMSLEDDETLVNLLKQYNPTDAFDVNIFDDAIVGDKLFDKFQELMKQGSKAFVDTTFELVEILNRYEQNDDKHVSASANATEVEVLMTKEVFLNTLKYVLAKKKILIDLAMGALSGTDQEVSHNSSFTAANAQKINVTDLKEIAEDALNMWLMELLMNDKINEIADEEGHNLKSQPAIIYADKEPSFEELTGEIIALTVGHPLHRRKLIAVASRRKSTVPGRHDLIYLYENAIGESIFQTLPCHEPSGLTALHLRDETLLVFVEEGVEVQIYSYQGIEGFKKVSQFHLKSPALHLTSVSLPTSEDHRVNFLVVTMMREILFLEAKMMGNCRVDVEVNCDD
ncbi:uncharacterized protein LOC132263698 isoform X2 [Phlebotomus argentipes]|uniref:uncharacterized protein LOC132263698 isoform X2 n=1 Tax=Phlebotomus argentipes TaxID=94469 RepID=UPI002893214F|nr:uncharacterized protein LOC132263698 isoform X2 [Phlebotomus argentipes]